MDIARDRLTDRIVVALDYARAARASADIPAEWFWSDIVDRLLDRYAQGYR